MSLVNLIKTFGRGGSLEDYMNAIEAEAAHLTEGVRPGEDAKPRTPAVPEEGGEQPMSPSQKVESTRTLVKLIGNTFRISGHLRRVQKPTKHEGTQKLFEGLEALAKDLSTSRVFYRAWQPHHVFCSFRAKRTMRSASLS